MTCCIQESGHPAETWGPSTHVITWSKKMPWRLKGQSCGRAAICLAKFPTTFEKWEFVTIICWLGKTGDWTIFLDCQKEAAMTGTTARSAALATVLRLMSGPSGGKSCHQHMESLSWMPQESRQANVLSDEEMACSPSYYNINWILSQYQYVYIYTYVCTYSYVDIAYAA